MSNPSESRSRRLKGQKGDHPVPLNRDELRQSLADAFDNGLYKSVKTTGQEQNKGRDKIYISNTDYWLDTIAEKNHVGTRVVLKEFAIIEWMPASPGLFFTESAIHARLNAEHFFNHSESEFFLLGKFEMVKGGVGSVRLGSEYTAGNIHYVCATSSGTSHEGIPLIMDNDSYLALIDEIKTTGSSVADITGTIAVLRTDKSLIKFHRDIPKYCVIVESVSRAKKEIELVSVSVAAAFHANEYLDLNPGDTNIAWTFCTFYPGSKDLMNLSQSVDWLLNYCTRYSKNPKIVSDFDEQRDHFSAPVEFPLKAIVADQVRVQVLKQYQTTYQLNIKHITMGDHFENVSGTIINRSVVENSLNKISSQIDQETMKFLKDLTSQVEKSGSKDAVENLEEFHKEIQKPAPKKSVLTALWNGVVTAIPSLLINADKVVDLIEKVTKIIPH